MSGVFYKQKKRKNHLPFNEKEFEMYIEVAKSSLEEHFSSEKRVTFEDVLIAAIELVTSCLKLCIV